MRKIRSLIKTIKHKLNYHFVELPKYENAKINTEPWFILGFQKGGTTAISRLLSLASNKTLTPDFLRSIPHTTLELELRYGLLSFDNFIEKYKYEFSNDLIKEPLLTFFTDELFHHFPKAKYLFIVRDPYQNIRSILNRLKIPGNLQDIDMFQWEELKKTPKWKISLQSEMIGIPSHDYIEAMAHRWNFAVQTYLTNKDKFILVKYEDFNKDKEKYIYELCKKMKLNIINDISEHVNVQYQPKGNRNMDIEEFFGETNLKKIKSICGVNMKKLGYDYI